MIERHEVEDLIERFREWLLQTNEDLAAADWSELLAQAGHPLNLAAQPGSLEMVEAFTALRHETKLLTKGVRALNDQVARDMDEQRGAAEVGGGLGRDGSSGCTTPGRRIRTPARRCALLEQVLDLDETLWRACQALQRRLQETNTTTSPTDASQSSDAAQASQPAQAVDSTHSATASPVESSASPADRIEACLQRSINALPAWRRFLIRPFLNQLREEIGVCGVSLEGSGRHNGSREAQETQFRLKQSELEVRHLVETMQQTSEGLQMIRDRVARALAMAGVRRIDCVGRPFDATLMRAIEVVDDPSRPAESVVAELRPGYVWNDEPLRLADVRAISAR